MSATSDCPGIERWQALLADTLPPDQQQHCKRHLESCTACQERLDQPEECGDTLLRLARQVGDPTRTPADPALVKVLEWLHETTGPDADLSSTGWWFGAAAADRLE